MQKAKSMKQTDVTVKRQLVVAQRSWIVHNRQNLHHPIVHIDIFHHAALVLKWFCDYASSTPLTPLMHLMKIHNVWRTEDHIHPQLSPHLWPCLAAPFPGSWPKGRHPAHHYQRTADRHKLKAWSYSLCDALTCYCLTRWLILVIFEGICLIDYIDYNKLMRY